MLWYTCRSDDEDERCGSIVVKFVWMAARSCPPVWGFCAAAAAAGAACPDGAVAAGWAAAGAEVAAGAPCADVAGFAASVGFGSAGLAGAVAGADGCAPQAATNSIAPEPMAALNIWRRVMCL